MGTFRQQIKVFVDANLSDTARSARLAGAAKRAVTDLISEGRASARFTRYVDGRAGVDESAVRPDGLISYEFHYIGEAAEFALDFLRARATPKASGQYVRGFRVAVNGRPITPAQFNKSMVPPGAEVFVYNVEPYSRKIDTGYVGARRLKYRIPPGLFDECAKAIRARFGNSVSAKRLYTLAFPGQVRAKHGGRLVDSPAVAIAPL